MTLPGRSRGTSWMTQSVLCSSWCPILVSTGRVHKPDAIAQILARASCAPMCLTLDDMGHQEEVGTLVDSSLSCPGSAEHRLHLKVPMWLSKPAPNTPLTQTEPWQ